MLDWQTLLFSAVHLISGLIAGGHALLHKTAPRSAQVWLIICLFIPYLGPFTYFVFGINRIETRAKRLLDSSTDSPPVRAPSSVAQRPFSAFAEIGDRVTNTPGVGGNKISTLINGENAYAAMLKAIESSKRSVYLSTYIFSNDAIGRRFVSALQHARQRDVQVRVLIDAIGECYSFPRISRELNRAEIAFKRFLPPRWFPPFGYVNLRTHRKLLLVDDTVGFCGGMNISGRHMINSEGIRRVEDVQFEFSGPILADLHQVFEEDWHFAAKESLPKPQPSQNSGTTWCRVIPDGPNEDLNKLSMVIQGAITNAKQSVTIMTPYFLPERELLVGLQMAALRGLNVDILLPERSNLPYVDWATQHLLPELTERGVRIFRRAPFSHAKLLVVDDCYALVGTANLDPRSLRLNFELGVEIFDENFAINTKQLIYSSIEESKETTTDWLAQRSLPIKLRDAFLALFSPYL